MAKKKKQKKGGHDKTLRKLIVTTEALRLIREILEILEIIEKRLE